jgi:hypothetical protein
MKGKWHIVVGLLFVVSLLHQAWIWGGLSRAPDVGPVVLDATGRELSLASVYRPLGTLLVDTLGMSDSASQSALAHYASARERLLEAPTVAMQTLHDSMPSVVSTSYFGTPLLLAAFFIAWWLRPRSVPSMGRRR